MTIEMQMALMAPFILAATNFLYTPILLA